MVETIIVETGLDVADKWILNQLKSLDIIVTYDIPLASDAIKLGAFAMTPYGKELNPSNIGSTLATRNLMHDIRSANQFLENKNTTFCMRTRQLEEGRRKRRRKRRGGREQKKKLAVR